MPFTVPAHRRKVRWQLVLDTFAPSIDRKRQHLMRGGEIYDLKERSLVLLRLPLNGDGEEKTSVVRTAARRNHREAGSPAPA